MSHPMIVSAINEMPTSIKVSPKGASLNIKRCAFFNESVSSITSFDSHLDVLI